MNQVKIENFLRELRKGNIKKSRRICRCRKSKIKKKVRNIFKWMCLMLLGSVLIGFFANQLDSIWGCACFIFGIVLLVVSTMLMSRQE